MAEDPAVDSIEVDCLERVDMSLPATPEDEAVARRLTVHDGAPWGIDRIDTNGQLAASKTSASPSNPARLITRAHCERPTLVYPVQAARSTASTTTATLEGKVCVFTS